MKPKRKRPENEPIVRKDTVRIARDVAARVRAGHPWIYREALGTRKMTQVTGELLEVVDPTGAFVGRGVYDKGSTIALRIMTWDKQERIGSEWILQRVREAVRLRARLITGDINAYRVINAEADGLPAIAVDRYADYLIVHFFSESVLGFREALLDALETVCTPKAIYEQRRFRSLSGDSPPSPAELVRGKAAPVEVLVCEGPLKFWVDVTAPLSTGLFLDLRNGRECVAKWAKGRRVLNLFSYTGALSVAAKSGGAKSVVAVDISAKAHARARKNFAANDFDPEEPEHVVGDIFKVLAKYAERNRRFDMIVLDPPAFGTGGNRGKTFSATNDYRRLVESSLQLLDAGGVVCAATATRKISFEELDRILATGASRAGARLRIVERQFLPADFCVSPGFPEGNYLKFAVAMRP